ncbi:MULTISPECIES: Na+/H+ antiporter subunit D [Niallia]|jgi:multicomponent Na+:H+ antiporter subunit D|uniref:Na+/H+ antiporter subunit D n=1 Tax=Niallia circulans TaxID=1397 RepID=A0A268FBX9_NIACI|nr:Na+/H+ antiporter subunit D [Niallia circulans]AYV67604.1 Na+/H+ antiporter subunit D [Niallia circulans]AYV74039.1 Na+/H+ antiporter subunit D [Niallia circulans]NRG27185.1 Na+/H+ antiporter subunit D [Niallia circulans]PAD82881.1 Na+/H+ antiporter subunit D [Niallia circulans]QJX63550.1 Na+/H+ antiporter subunit D [Niallia circulans]
MSNLILFPILIPLLTGIILIFFYKKTILQRIISLLSTSVSIIIVLFMIDKIKNEGIQTVNLSNWDAPFGITIVADMVSALLVLTTNIIAFCCILYSFKGIDRERENYFYYAMIQFLLVGVIGAFSTGDIFNLFVFFEVMLMASYVLLVLGNTKIQLRETVKYIIVNVVASALFVIAVAYFYSVVGTLNMASISERISEVGGSGILTVIAVLFLIVFGLKGALFPLFFWLPGSYYAAPIPILALFGALLTKVGVYSIARTYSLFFYEDSYVFTLLGILSLLTIILGAIGAIAYNDVKKIIIYNIVTAIGVILYGFSIFNSTSLNGAIFYLLHDMIIKGALFLLIGIMIYITGTSNLKYMSGLMKKYPLLTWTFFLAALSLAGIPPLSGFIGKLLIIQGAFEERNYMGSFIVVLSSLLVLLSVIKIFVKGFWGEESDNITIKSIKTLLLPGCILVLLSCLIGIGTEMISPYISLAVESLLQPENYIHAVLKE